MNGCPNCEPLRTANGELRNVSRELNKNSTFKESVITNISESQIIKFIYRLNFMQHVSRAVKDLVRSKRKAENATLKDVSPDVRAIKDFLRAKIGTTYAAATQQSNDNLLSVDMSDWGGRAYPRSNAPFQQLRDA